MTMNLLDKLREMRKEIEQNQKDMNESRNVDKLLVSCCELGWELRALDESLYQKQELFSKEQYDNLTKLVSTLESINEMQIVNLAHYDKEKTTKSEEIFRVNN